MKSLIVILALCWIAPPPNTGMGAHEKTEGQDTINLKCILFSPKLFYGCELGEKPMSTLVDTLVGEIQNYDSSCELHLVTVSLKELGFGGWKGIPCNVILDSARRHGYKLCPPQTAPELIVLSQIGRRSHPIFSKTLSDSKPYFIGMNTLRHYSTTDKQGKTIGHSRGSFFDYIFCVKSSHKKGECQLGFCATTNTTHIFSWTDDDRFIFVQNTTHRKSAKNWNKGLGKHPNCTGRKAKKTIIGSSSISYRLPKLQRRGIFLGLTQKRV